MTKPINWKSTYTHLVALAGLILASSALSTQAQSATYSPYAISSLLYENNLFRVANDAEAVSILNDDDPSDTIFRLGAGIEGKLDISRQSVSYNAHLYRSKYSNFSKLDHTGGAAKLKANYEIGDLWFGTASYQIIRELSNFEQFQQFLNSIKTRNQFDVDLHRRLTTRINALGGVGYTAVGFDGRGSAGDESNRQVVDLFVGIEYITPLKNTIGARFNFGEIRFPDRTIFLNDPLEIDNEYVENGLDIFVDWSITPQSQFKGSVGYLDREQEHFSSGNFSGIVTGLQYQWTPREKFKVKASVTRDLSSLEGEALNYVLTEGFTIEPVWSLTSKVKLSLLYNREKRDFQGISDLAVGIESSTRKDTINKYRLGIDYQPRRFMHVELYYGAGDRESSDKQNDYDFDHFGAKLKFNLR